MNPNYVVVVKQDLDKLIAMGFITLVEEATWLSPIVVLPKKLTSSKFVWISKI
jgi:hypothetical protein